MNDAVQNVERRMILVSMLIIGIGIGIAVHRLAMAIILEKYPDNICAYCEWCERKKSRHKK